MAGILLSGVILLVVIVALLKAPKGVLVTLFTIALIGVPAIFYMRMSQHTPRQAIVMNSLTPGQSVPAPPRMGSENRATIVLFDQPPTQPSTQPSGKPWVDDWQSFVNSNRRQRYLRAGTTSPWGSEEEARREARLQAAVLLRPYIAAQVRTTSRLVIGTRVVSTNDWILHQLQQSLMQNQLVLDEYIQREQRPYGETWSCQLLLDASPQALARTASDYTRQAQRQLETSAVTWGGLAGLSLVIVLLYAFLNWATKGYFVWRLRAAAAMAVIVAVLVVMAAV
jgi:hypothetical protein